MPDEAFRHMWHLSEAGDDNLGLACTDSGLLLGRTALIERRDDSYVVRDRSEIEWLLGRAYGTDISAARLMSGLATVARALSANDQCLARIAAVHLRIPDIPDRTARDAMEVEDVLVKSGDWNPALHPRTGTPPNPGWFAPTEDSGESSPVRPHKTTIQYGGPMPRQVQVTIGSDCGPARNESTNSPTSSNGSPTQGPRMRRQ